MRPLLLPLLLSTVAVRAQDVQWASHLVGYSSQAGKAAYAAVEALGPPNKLPAFGDCGCAWSPASMDGEMAEYLKVGFADPQRIRQVVVAENHNPGAITRITAFDLQNRAEVIYEREEPEALRAAGRHFLVEVPRTKLRVAALRIDLDPSSAPGFNQIDAVGLSGSGDPVHVAIERFAGLAMYGEPEDLGPAVNSRYSEILPRFHPDGSALWFIRKDHPDNYGGTINDDIWVAAREGDGWAPARNAGWPLNTANHNGVCGVSDDGVLTLANRYLEKGKSAPGIAQSFLSSDRWIVPLNLTIDRLYTGGLYAEYFMDRTRRHLLLAIEPLDSRGGRDLYVSHSEDGLHWSRPESLGPAINTAGDEMSPFLAADGRTLYFSSNAHRGYGDQDIFVSARRGEGWTDWTKPANLGPRVNTPLWESHFVIDPAEDWAYFATTRDAFGNADILRISLREPPVEPPAEEDSPPDTPVAEGANRPPPPAYPFPEDLLVFGYVHDGSDGSYIPAELTFSMPDDPTRRHVASTLNAQYQLRMGAGGTYRVRIRAEGYAGLDTTVTFAETGRRVRRRDFELFPPDWTPPGEPGPVLETGALIRLQSLHFNVNSAVIRHESYPELDRLAEGLLEHPELQVIVEGHTNANCAKKFCDRLSRSRARRVAAYLIDAGINESRVEWAGFGKDHPIANNETAEGRALNQRVEIRVE